MTEPQKVEEIYAFVMVQADGAEYIPCIVLPQVETAGPAVCDNTGGLKTLKLFAPTMAKSAGQKVRLLRFTYREQMEEWAP